MSSPLSRYLQQLHAPAYEKDPVLSGRLTRVVGLSHEGQGIKIPIGPRCRV